MKKFLFIILIFLGFLFSFPLREKKTEASLDFKLNPSRPEPKVSIDFGKIPLYFIQNMGQVDQKALFYAKTPHYTLWVTKEGLVFDRLIGEEKRDSRERVKRSQSKIVSRDVIKLKFAGAKKNPQIIPEEKSSYRVNYFIGKDPSKWHKDIPTSHAVRYREIYDGIDIKVYGKESQIEYDYIVKPGASPENIVFQYEGAKTYINEGGDIVVKTPYGELIQKRPFASQEGKEVEVRFKELGDGRYGLEVGSYERNKELLIDPVVLSYSTYLGGSDRDAGWGIAVDSSGSAYVTGFTYSTDFPTANPYQANYRGLYDVFVTKLSPQGNSLLYSTYLGGSSNDYGCDIAVDSSGCAYVSGSTYSTDFPTVNPYQANNRGLDDAFVTKLSPQGNSLLYSTYLGGSSSDGGYGIAIDSSGCAYVTGYTYSTDFPTANPYQANKRDSHDAFVTKLSPQGNSLIYSTYLGGSGTDIAFGIAVDSYGSAYVTGVTYSTYFPIVNPYQANRRGLYDAFVTKLSPQGNSLIYSTFLGGSSENAGRDIAVDSSGCAYVSGLTSSTDFPTANPYQANNRGGWDVFVTKFSPQGNSLLYSTYLGGSSDDWGRYIAVDSYGSVYVTGVTYSTDFPTENPYQANLRGIRNAFVTKLSPQGNSLLYSTYLGGSGSDVGVGIAVDSSGFAYVSGYTASADFPTKNPYQAYFGGGLYDAFVAKIKFNIPPVAIIEGKDTLCSELPVDVPLSGKKSYDPDGWIVEYRWNLDEKPEGSNAFLKDVDRDETVLHADKGGIYKVSLVVMDDSEEWSSPASHSVRVEEGVSPRVFINAKRQKERAWIIVADYSELEISLRQSWGCIERVAKVEIKRKGGGEEKVVASIAVTEFQKDGDLLKYKLIDKYLKKGVGYQYLVYGIGVSGKVLTSAEASI